MISVIGSDGAIGSALFRSLLASGETVKAFNRKNMPTRGEYLGTALYCIGVTSDYRSRLVETAQSHVSVLADIIQHCNFDRILYVSSTRVYAGQGSGREDARITVDPTDPLEIYTLSKLVGESLVAGLGADRGVVVRLSNVLGPNANSANFVYDLCRQAVSGKVLLRSPLDSRKDYVHLDDVVRLLPAIARESRMNIYNVASGVSIATREIIDAIRLIVPCEVSVELGTKAPRFPEISSERLNLEFGSMAHAALQVLPALIEAMKREKRDHEST